MEGRRKGRREGWVGSRAHENRMGWIPNTETDYAPSNPDNPQKRRATKCTAFQLKPLQKDVRMCTYFHQRPNTSKSAKEARARSCTPASSETKMANAKRRACRGREHGQGMPSEAWPIMSTGSQTVAGLAELRNLVQLPVQAAEPRHGPACRDLAQRSRRPPPGASAAPRQGAPCPPAAAIAL